MQDAARWFITHKAERTIPGGWFRRARRPLRVTLGVAALLVLAGSPAGRPQATSGSNQSQPTVRQPFPGRQDLSEPFDDVDPMLAERRLRALNMERQKLMVADANKLLKLARELNAEVATTKSDSFTPDELHKIAEIEKLARNVKERMASAVGPAQPSLMPPPSIVYPTH